MERTSGASSGQSPIDDRSRKGGHAAPRAVCWLRPSWLSLPRPARGNGFSVAEAVVDEAEHPCGRSDAVGVATPPLGDGAVVGFDLVAAVVAADGRHRGPARAGDVQGALQAGPSELELRQSLDDTPLAVSASEFLAYALVDAGQVAHGMALLLDATGGPEMPRIGVHCRAVPDDVLTRGALSLGSVAEAAEWASRAELCARDGQLCLTVAAARGARAVVLLEKGTPWLLEISPSRPWHSDSRLRRRSRWRTPESSWLQH